MSGSEGFDEKDGNCFNVPFFRSSNQNLAFAAQGADRDHPEEVFLLLTAE